MKIVKKGENSVANGTSMGANELSDEKLEGVGGGYFRITPNEMVSEEYKGCFVFYADEAAKLGIDSHKLYKLNELASLLGCESDEVGRKLTDLGIVKDRYTI